MKRYYMELVMWDVAQLKKYVWNVPLRGYFCDLWSALQSLDAIYPLPCSIYCFSDLIKVFEVWGRKYFSFCDDLIVNFDFVFCHTNMTPKQLEYMSIA